MTSNGGLAHGRLRDGAFAGICGGLVFAAVMAVDMAVSRRKVNDFLLLGGLGPAPALWKITGPVLHVTNSAALGVVYAQCEPLLRGPGWLRAVTFALIENTLLWPLVILIDHIHPAVKSGELPSYNRPWPFVAENLRHVAYGFTLGLIFERMRDRN